MKKLSYLFVLLVAFLAVPLMVFAEGEESEQVTSSEVKEEVPIYFFRGEGCPHCKDAEEWFASIEEEYGQYFKVVDYETWQNTDNAELMQKVATARGEEANGVPYIIIGNKSWNGFTDSYTTEMIEQIMEVYGQDVQARYDILKLVNGTDKKDEKNNDVLVLILILIIAGGICFGVYKARSKVNE